MTIHASTTTYAAPKAIDLADRITKALASIAGDLYGNAAESYTTALDDAIVMAQGETVMVVHSQAVEDAVTSAIDNGSEDAGDNGDGWIMTSTRDVPGMMITTYYPTGSWALHALRVTAAH